MHQRNHRNARSLFPSNSPRIRLDNVNNVFCYGAIMSAKAFDLYWHVSCTFIPRCFHSQSFSSFQSGKRKILISLFKDKVHFAVFFISFHFSSPILRAFSTLIHWRTLFQILEFILIYHLLEINFNKLTKIY